jgi:glucose/arabinose dehydrogenase
MRSFVPRLIVWLYIFLASAAYAAEPNARIETIARGLDTAWAIAFAPDGRIFLTERPGRIRVIKDGELQSEPWLKIAVYEGGESGLLGLALDPGFARGQRYVYTAYTYRDSDGKLKNRLVRLRDDNGKGVLDKILLDNAAGGSNHDGGRLRFGPDGKLYWTMGDAQESGLGQDLKSLNGKILRINPDGSFPADNSLPQSPVYSYGHRNPQGLAWQPESGRLYETEPGPSGIPCCHDEVNLIEPGKNYGWPAIYGDQSKAGMIAPVLQSGNDTWAPGGATFVTRKESLWAGSFLFTGLRGQALYRVVFDAKDPRKVALFERYFERKFGRLRDVTEGPDGALYLLTSNRDGRGRPGPEDDRVLRLVFK